MPLLCVDLFQVVAGIALKYEVVKRFEFRGALKVAVFSECVLVSPAKHIGLKERKFTAIRVVGLDCVSNDLAARRCNYTFDKEAR